MQVKICVDGDVLSLAVEKSGSKEEKKESHGIKYHRSPCSCLTTAVNPACTRLKGLEDAPQSLTLCLSCTRALWRSLDADLGSSVFGRVERSSTYSQRQIRLPDSADFSKISAKMDNGVLKLDVPKQEVWSGCPQ